MNNFQLAKVSQKTTNKKKKTYLNLVVDFSFSYNDPTPKPQHMK
jgi:hypothetical protein